MIETWIPRIEEAGRGERGDVIKEIGRLYGWSRDKVYRELKKAGWSPERTRRRDAGDSTVSEESLKMLAAYMKSGVRKNGKIVLDVPTARSVLEQNGVDFGGVTNSRLSGLLKTRGLDIRTQKEVSSHVRMRSLYPNQVHQVDPSLCLVYYLPGGGQKIIRDDEAYKNKPFLEGKAHLKVWRYVLTDHYSSTICVRYYQRPGESQVTLWDFLLYAWGIKPNPEFIFHGVPEILVWDKGSANMSKAVANALKGLRVDAIPHAPGNPRAKGQVECSNNLVEKLFEARLKAEPVMNVDELNAAAERWCSMYNAGTIDGYDSTLRRAGVPRTELWQRIPYEKLRELPEDSRMLLTPEPVTRKVGMDLRITFAHPRIKQSRPYIVGGLPGIRPGQIVEVQPILMDAGGIIRVSYSWQGEEFSEEILPVELDDAGFHMDAAVWGQEFKANKETYIEKAGKELDEKIGSEKTPFAWWNEGEGLKSISGIRKEVTNIVPAGRIGTQITPPEAPEIILTTVEAAKRLKSRMEHWESSYLMIIRERFPRGVPDSALDSLEEILNTAGGNYVAVKDSAG